MGWQLKLVWVNYLINIVSLSLLLATTNAALRKTLSLFDLKDIPRNVNNVFVPKIVIIILSTSIIKRTVLFIYYNIFIR